MVSPCPYGEIKTRNESFYQFFSSCTCGTENWVPICFCVFIWLTYFSPHFFSLAPKSAKLYKRRFLWLLPQKKIWTGLAKKWTKVYLQPCNVLEFGFGQQVEKVYLQPCILLLLFLFLFSRISKARKDTVLYTVILYILCNFSTGFFSWKVAEKLSDPLFTCELFFAYVTIFWWIGFFGSWWFGIIVQFIRIIDQRISGAEVRRRCRSFVLHESDREVDQIAGGASVPLRSFGRIFATFCLK